MNRVLPVLIAVLLVSSAAWAQPFSTNFDNFSEGLPAGLLPVPGITFVPENPNSWVVSDAFRFTGLSGKSLIQPGGQFGALDVIFDAPVDSVSFNFAMNSRQPGSTAVI